MIPTPSDANKFDRVQPWKEFRRTAKHLFPTDDSLRWFMRSNAAALRESGAVLKLARGTYIDPDPFRRVAITLMQGAEPQGEKS